MRCNGGTVWTIYKESVMRSKVQKSPHLWVLLVGIAPRCRRWPRQLELTLDWAYSLGPGRLFLSPNGFSNYLFLSRGLGDWAPWCLGFAWWLSLVWLRELGVVTIGGEGFETGIWKMWDARDDFLVGSDGFKPIWEDSSNVSRNHMASYPWNEAKLN